MISLITLVELTLVWGGVGGGLKVCSNYLRIEENIRRLRLGRESFWMKTLRTNSKWSK